MADEAGPTEEGSSSLPDAPDSDAGDLDRRSFMVRVIAVIGGAIAAALGIPATVFVTGSARQADEEGEWIRLGSVSSVEVGAAPALLKASVSRRVGYLVEEQEVSVFVTTPNGADFTVLSNICTHLGCRVRWVDDRDGFFCPCHNAIFGPDGEVVQGPPPRPLDRFEFLVEEGQLYFKEL